MLYAPARVRLPKEDLKIGKYQLLQRLASGGMGEVFLALQEGPAGFLRKVVIKRMRSPITENPAFVEMFLNEARLAALLSHPNVVHILELGQAEDGAWFIAMEHIHGRSLREVLIARSRRSTPGLPPELAARLCADVLRGLHHAHEMRDAQGRRLEIIHRDVSPENVLVSFSGTVKVVDFGIAKAVAESTSITHVSQLKGKVPYLAPEQLRLERADARTDVYAAGCVLYEMLAGRSAFPIRSEADLMEEVLTSMPVPLGKLRPYIPEALGAITQRAMARSPAERFASAQEMATALEDFLLETQVRVPPEEVSRFLTGLFGAPAAALTPAAGIPRASSRTAALPASTPKPSPELSTDLEFTQLAVPLSPTPEPPASGPHGAPLPRQLRHVPAGEPTLVVEELAAELREEPVTEVSRHPGGSPESVRVEPVQAEPVRVEPVQVAPAQAEPARMEPVQMERPAGGAPTKPPGRRRRLPLVVAITLGVLLVAAGAGLLLPGSGPPAIVASEVPVQAGSEPMPELPPSPPAPRASLEKSQAAPEPPLSGTVRPSISKDRKTRSSRMGRIVLHVQPSSEVFVGSKRLGMTPLEPIQIELPAGQHTLTLKCAELSVTRRITVKVPAGGKVSIKENLALPASKWQ
jgi:eukaryotic-like serine/threonine-protein kinase